LASVFERIVAGEKVESKATILAEKKSEKKDDISEDFKKSSEKRENKEATPQIWFR